MEIPLFGAGDELRFERIVLYPYPDLKRVWTRIWLSAMRDEAPNIEIAILNADGSENSSIYMMSHGEPRAETTLHIRNGRPGDRFRVVAVLTRGLTETPEELDRREFDLLLEFRNPDAGDEGFGFGVDWEDVRRKRGGEGA